VGSLLIREEGQTGFFRIDANSFIGPGVQDLKVLDELPSGLKVIGNTPFQGTYDEDTGVWSVGSIEGTTRSLLSLKYYLEPVVQTL